MTQLTGVQAAGHKPSPTAALKGQGLRKAGSIIFASEVILDAGQRRKSQQKMGNHCPVTGRISQTVLLWTISVPQYIYVIFKSVQSR